ncbi:hypothetical protein GGF46_000971 [Coemansia sp. RSA 552]|nr:hypothetical protein GGF46_000971 [Coemansia sp. RSA 552]
MKLTTALVALVALAGLGDAQALCQSNAQRKEIRSLTSAEWTRTSTVAKQMQDNGWFQWFAYLHTANFGVIHNCEIFLPWHRRFLLDFEQVGRRFDPNFALPYWDEVRDYANPAASSVLTAAYAGGNGVGNDLCVANGLQASWTMTYPSGHCLRRQYNNNDKINPMYSPEYIQSLLSRSTKMSELRPAIEFSLHGAIHLALGGDMVATYSPNDFVFWLHHANIDRLWFVWQMQNPNQNFWSMDGQDTAKKAIGLNSALPYYGDIIINTMYPSRNGMCFSYDNFSNVGNMRKRSVAGAGEKCIPRPSNVLGNLVDGVIDDVNAVMADSIEVVTNTLKNTLTAPVLNKWFPTLANNATRTYTSADIPEPPAVIDSDVKVHEADEGTGMEAPALPTESFDIAGAVIGTSVYSTPEIAPTPADDYVGSSVPISSAPYESETESSDEAEESSSESEGVHDDDVVAIPVDGSDTYDAIAADNYNESYRIFDTTANPAAAGLEGDGPKYLMPMPFPFSSGFIKMHGYSVDQIKNHYALAKEFVGDLNTDNYQSPYAKGAQSLVGNVAAAQNGCGRIVERRDISSLSPQEWGRMADVIQKMQKDGWFEHYAEVHNREFGNIHGNDNFFPWHRRFLRDFEEVGQRYDPNFAVPYWDELRDSRSPGSSVVLSPRFIGGNGGGSCVRDGLQAGWTLGFPNRHCLVRAYDRGSQMQPWYSPEYIFSVMQRYGDMHGFREHIEYSLHGSVHLGMGGDMGTYWSANDFAFWLHHANLDRIWSQWQSWGHESTMDGRNHVGAAMSLAAPLPHYGEPAGSTIRLGTGRMCFRYSGGGRPRNALSLVSEPGSAAEADVGLHALPDHVRRKWFPLLDSRWRTVAQNNTHSIQSVTRVSGTPLPYPAPLTDMWISMHKLDRAAVARIMSEAHQFVDELNGAKYRSPY